MYILILLLGLIIPNTLFAQTFDRLQEGSPSFKTQKIYQERGISNKQQQDLLTGTIDDEQVEEINAKFKRRLGGQKNNGLNTITKPINPEEGGEIKLYQFNTRLGRPKEVAVPENVKEQSAQQGKAKKEENSAISIEELSIGKRKSFRRF